MAGLLFCCLPKSLPATHRPSLALAAQPLPRPCLATGGATPPSPAPCPVHLPPSCPTRPDLERAETWLAALPNSAFPGEAGRPSPGSDWGHFMRDVVSLHPPFQRQEESCVINSLCCFHTVGEKPAEGPLKSPELVQARAGIRTRVFLFGRPWACLNLAGPPPLLCPPGGFEMSKSGCLSEREQSKRDSEPPIIRSSLN